MTGSGLARLERQERGREWLFQHGLLVSVMVGLIAMAWSGFVGGKEYLESRDVPREQATVVQIHDLGERKIGKTRCRRGVERLHVEQPRAGFSDTVEVEDCPVDETVGERVQVTRRREQDGSITSVVNPPGLTALVQMSLGVGGGTAVAFFLVLQPLRLGHRWLNRRA